MKNFLSLSLSLSLPPPQRIFFSLGAIFETSGNPYQNEGGGVWEKKKIISLKYDRGGGGGGVWKSEILYYIM